MDRQVLAAPVVPVAGLALHQIVRPAGTNFQTIKPDTPITDAAFLMDVVLEME